MDVIGWFIATSHNLLGHDKTAALIGAPPGDRAACVMCKADREPTEANRAAVERAIGGPSDGRHG